MLGEDGLGDTACGDRIEGAVDDVTGRGMCS
jgi:hypothetical protein